MRADYWDIYILLYVAIAAPPTPTVVILRSYYLCLKQRIHQHGVKHDPLSNAPH